MFLFFRQKTACDVRMSGWSSDVCFYRSHVLAGAGAKVGVADINIGAAQGVVNEIRDAGGEAAAVGVDVADEASVAAMGAFAVDTYGRLDGAHNNAGIEMVNKPIHELTDRKSTRLNSSH